MIRSLRVFGHFVLLTSLIAFSTARVAQSQLIVSAWNTGNGSWNVPANWTPNSSAPSNGAPLATNTYNVSIGNLPIANGAQVTFVPPTGTNATISTLTVSNNADLVTNGNQLNVLTSTVIDGAGTTIRVDPHTTPGTAAFTSQSLALNNGGGLTMMGGIATIGSSNVGQLEINAGSVLGGHGTVNVGDADGVPEQAFENSALLQPQGNTAAPQTLTIHANGIDSIDLDGDSETGIIDVDNQLVNNNADTVTLVIDGPLDDAFGGVGATSAQLQIGQRDTLTFTKNFSIAGGAVTPVLVTMTGGNSVATLNGAGAITSITNSTWSMTGDAVISNSMTFSGVANTITLNANSSLELGGVVVIPDASALAVPTSTSELIVSGSTTISEQVPGGDFNWDGSGLATTTVKGIGQLSLTVDRVDQGDDLYGGTLNLDDNGGVFVDTTANSWTMAGTIHKRNAGTSAVTGDGVTISGAVIVDTGTLTLPGATTLATTSVTGAGLLRLMNTSTVTANTTINTTSFDWDGATAGTLHTINTGVVFTINSTTFDDDGDMDDPINIGGTGATLAVNGAPSWKMLRTLTTNTPVTGIATLNGTSRMILEGNLAVWNANGQTSVNAPVTFGNLSTTNIAAAGFIRLNGGDNVSVFNRIEGGTINGPNGPNGLVAINNRELRGFGTINAPITFQNTSALRADDGTLTIGGVINEVSTIGTADIDGTLNVVNAWNSNVAANVVLNGGVLQGGAITVANANGIKGRGTVSSRVINNARLEANVAASSLVFETAANDNDWDGGANTGILAASNGGTLEVRDNATFTYGGTVTATGGSKVYAKGFGFNMATTSVINLTNSTLQTDESSNFDGAINIAAGGDSTLNVQVNRFLTIGSTSTVSLGSNLKLVTNNGAIEAGATFSGAGAVIVPAGSHLITEPGAIINTLLVNEGTVRPSGFNTVGAETVANYQQTNTGLLEVELTGTLLNQFDRFAIPGVAQVDGSLVIDIDGAFVPALGNTFNIISATGGVAGTFDNVDVSGFPAGLTYHINYLPTIVQIQVVPKPSFEADFDDDGDVDSTDYAIWRNAFQLNQLGDATGDNTSNANDYVVWRKQSGSHPGAGSGSLADAAGVPEPATLGLFAVAAFGILCQRRTLHKR